MIFSLNTVKDTKFGTLANALVMCLGPEQIVNLDLEKVNLDIKVNEVGIDFAKLVRAMEPSLKNPEEVGPSPPEQPGTNLPGSSKISSDLKELIDENLENPEQLHAEIVGYMRHRDSDIKNFIKDIEDRVGLIDIEVGLDSGGLADTIESDIDHCISEILNTSRIRDIVRDALDDAYIEPELCHYDVGSIQDLCESVSDILID